METDRDNITLSERDEEMEQAYYVLLSLCRRYSLDMLQHKAPKEECLQKIKQIKSDMKYLERAELIQKVNNYYQPLLQPIEQKPYNIQ